LARRRNALFIIMDQFRADLLTGALANHVDLPNIRALQGDAVTFTNHYSVVNPCGPSRASILTGLYSMNHRSVRNGTPLSANITNIALELRKSGYEPLLYGYTDTSLDPRVRHPNDPDLLSEEGVLPGFREIVEMRYKHSFPWRAHLAAKGYALPDFADFYNPVSPDPNRAARPDDPTFYSARDSDTAYLTDRLIDDLPARKRGGWFAMVTYIRPHPPLVAPAPYNKMYCPDDLPLPRRMATPDAEEAVHPVIAAQRNRPPMEAIATGTVGQLDCRRDADVQALRAIYLGMATEVDANIGRVIAYLKDSGQYDDTLIVLKSDHGEMLGDHHMWGKQHVYDPAYRVPLIIRDPDFPAQFGTRIDAFSESIDLAPTVLDLLGCAVPAGMDGRSLRPFLEGRTPENWKDCVHLELDFGEPDLPTAAQRATGLPLRQCNLAILREDRFKLVHFNGGLPPLLFDMLDDPDEMHDLAGDPAHAATLLRLTQKLLSHRMTHAEHSLSDMKLTDDGVVGSLSL